MRSLSHVCSVYGFVLACAAAAVLNMPPAYAADQKAEIDAKLHQNLNPHPRLFLNKGADAKFIADIRENPDLNTLYAIISQRAGEILQSPIVERKLSGKRLLGVSREFLNRVHVLGLMYRITGDQVYFDRAREEMLTVAGFTDWNPSHFLDVGEMSAGMGIGYDWFYDRLSMQDREIIRKAIVEKGIAPSFQAKTPWWVKSSNNWGQVCHGGLTIGALAIAEDEPELAAKVIERARENIPNIIARYQPDGIYPEGPDYWDYGTTYHVMMCAAMESAFGTDFGLSSDPAFEHTADFYLHVAGPTGLWFNFCDSGLRSSIAPAMWWFAGKFNNPSLLYLEQKKLHSLIDRSKTNTSNINTRFVPFLLLWTQQYAVKEPAAPTQTRFVGDGPTPLGIFRTSWDENATCVAIKGGSPSVSHGHMDVGTFFIDALGVRWAEDLGLQSYGTLESKKVDLWNFKADSQRWKVFRISVAAHNVLMVDGRDQVLDSQAAIIRRGENFAVVNLGQTYAGQLASARRGAMLNGAQGSVRIQDEITGADRDVTVRWAFVTHANMENAAEGRAQLSLNHKTMQLRLSGEPAQFQEYSTKGPNSFDAENTGTRMIGFEFKLKAGEKKTIAVDFIPGASDSNPVAIRLLADW